MTSKVKSESFISFFTVEKAQTQIIKNLTTLQNKYLFKRIFMNKEAEPKLHIYIRNYINMKNILDLEHVIKNLHDFVIELAAASYYQETGQLDLMNKRLIFLRSVLLSKPNLPVEEKINSIENIDSDCENNGKSNKQMDINENQLENKKTDGNKINYPEEIKNFFFTEAVNVKFSLPANEKKKELLISDLYEEAMKKNITVIQFREFLIQKYK